ncbi:MAG: hypothetical protein PVH85_30440 [Desulfobacterales bacterium]|jgi:hypothetical protein
MSQAVKQSVVYQDLLNLPENIIGEIINGELHTQPRPSPRHALAAVRRRGDSQQNRHIANAPSLNAIYFRKSAG